MIWKHLGSQFLQGQIGRSLLARLEPVLSTIEPRGAVNLYSRDSLAAIFDAFAGIERLGDKAFREQFFGRLPPAVLSQVAVWADITADLSNQAQTAGALAVLPWEELGLQCRFAKAAGVRSPLVSQQDPAIQTLVRLPAAERPLRQLQDYQSKIYFAALRFLDVPRARFLIQMPTGSGKTRTAMELVAEHLNRAGDLGQPTGVIWIAHSEELCSQAMECFTEVWQHLGRHGVDCHRFWGKGGVLPIDARLSFTVAGFQRLHAEALRNESVLRTCADKVSLVVVDEAHRVMAPTYKAVTDELLRPGGNLLGLTATPGRSATDHQANEQMAEYFHGEILRLEGSESLSPIALLRHQRILAKLSCDPLISRCNFVLTSTEREFIARNFDLPPGLLRRIGDDDVRNVEIVKRLISEARQGKRVIFFGCSVEHSRFICAILTYFGIVAAHLDGATQKDRRRALIASYKDGKISVLCNFGILTTGFDAPNTDVVFISRPTTSVVLYSQMVGRGLRGPKLGGTERCTLIDVRDNIDGLVGQAELYDFFSEYWD